MLLYQFYTIVFLQILKNLSSGYHEFLDTRVGFSPFSSTVTVNVQNQKSSGNIAQVIEMLLLGKPVQQELQSQHVLKLPDTSHVRTH